MPALSRRASTRQARLRAAWAGAVLLVLTSGTSVESRADDTSAAADPDKSPLFRVSLPTEADREVWLRDGFRLGLGVLVGEMVGVGGPPGARVKGVSVQVGLRLDPDWSLLATFQYGVMRGGFDGLRFAGTLDPTWHVTRHLSLAVGLGYGGISGASTSRAEGDVDPLPGTLGSSFTFPSARPTLPSCTGGGVAVLARAEWAVVLGARTSTNLALEPYGQWTGCEDPTGLVEPDTGHAIVRRQFWQHLGVNLRWGIMWR